jgi:uncharacterized protein (DUF1697 family)
VTRYVALLRGVNVGGSNKVAMSDLRQVLGSLGHTDVTTYLQSGNAVFTSPRDDPAALAGEIERQIANDLGVRATVLIRSRDELAAVVDGNPFATTDPRRLHVAFLAAAPDDGWLSAIDPSQYEPDEFRLGDRVLYLWYPNGLSGSRLTDRFWRSLKVPATDRNWRTVTKLLSLAEG